MAKKEKEEQREPFLRAVKLLLLPRTAEDILAKAPQYKRQDPEGQQDAPEKKQGQQETPQQGQQETPQQGQQDAPEETRGEDSDGKKVGPVESGLVDPILESICKGRELLDIGKDLSTKPPPLWEIHGPQEGERKINEWCVEADQNKSEMLECSERLKAAAQNESPFAAEALELANQLVEVAGSLVAPPIVRMNVFPMMGGREQFTVISRVPGQDRDRMLDNIRSVVKKELFKF